MSLEKTYSTLLIKTKLGKKEFLKSYINLLRAELSCTITAAEWARWPVLARWHLERTMYDFKNSLFTNFLLVHEAKYFFFKDMFFPIDLSEKF